MTYPLVDVHGLVPQYVDGCGVGFRPTLMHDSILPDRVHLDRNEHKLRPNVRPKTYACPFSICHGSISVPNLGHVCIQMDSA